MTTKKLKIFFLTKCALYKKRVFLGCFWVATIENKPVLFSWQNSFCSVSPNL